ncbi:MAG: hypothetical protein SPI03_00400 [Campylobacter sputorum]|uniref:hypothetical protein n=1 Tax=Campylobacter sputorum TaxID=206 RepID=UPI000B773316|nr:hypothetical protein [Campylobacter sputorum]ASM38564.1 putative membrane protein [Campylobacter sputorum bv. paraureolyticus LMG 11764]MDY6119788.1 hypothetical protein [Campylobacter sputorum]
MRFILILIIIVVAIIIYSINDEKLSKKSKLISTLVVFFICICIFIYESKISSISKEKTSLVTQFNQGKILKCGIYDVNKSGFNYEFGTSTFIPKNEFVNLKGVIINIKDCKIDE